ncbi:polysaccharide deacetylase family protein [Alicyclobacillus dauci]|uniref:Polysaccharide deacetylase family protein n=1 Tax=Alicyclobacillus dauci TaxID=1475485 RepID=A0ABY6Z2A5_9BACL|nr:polysaccharide deacetylase family protein [Alicyclobacillus dauci]WAH36961.1 polysaccharide deacetylase family protein [Alicyclobacillus dauci]
MQYGDLKTVEVLSVEEDHYGPFAKINVQLVDGEMVIRWGLDRYTYKHLRKVVYSGFGEFGPSANYRCMLLLNGGGSSHLPNRFVSSLMCQLGTQWIRIEFLCSALFLSNLEWLRNVETVQELDALCLERWTEHDLLLSGAGMPVDLTLATSGMDVQAQTSKFTRPFVVLAAVVVFGVLCGLVVFSHSYQTAASIFSRVHAFSLNTQGSTKEKVDKNEQKAANGPMTSVATGVGNGDTGGNGQLSSGNLSQLQVQPTLPVADLHAVPQIYKVPSGDVALTFNNGPSPYTEKIVQELNRYQAHATFFFIGSNVRRQPGVVQYVAKSGNAIGAQTLDYPNLSIMSASEQKREILDGIAEINRYVDTPVVLFRPPYDLFNRTTEDIVEQNHLVLALWNRDPRDWEAATPQQVVSSVLSSSASGGVFALQDNETTMLALPSILDKLESENLKFVVLSPNGS